MKRYPQAIFPLGGGSGLGTWHPEITSLSGGGSASLNSVSTLALVVTTTLYEFVNSATAGKQSWQLVAYTGQSGAGTQQPLDFNVSSNPKIWIQVA